jgi:hypothetical protein
MYVAVHAAGGISCYTEFPRLSHDLWNTVHVYSLPNFQAWVFSQTRLPAHHTHPLGCAGRIIDGVAAK